MDNFIEKCHKLTSLFEDLTKNDVVVAFSGGVDSSLLLKMACDNAKKHNIKVYALTIHTMLHPVKETNFTEEISRKMGAIHEIIQIDELSEAGIINNPKERCYLCKKYMFSQICEFAKKVDAKEIIDGTNYDDLHTYRPGIKALKELGVKSPLAEVGMTKEDVRKLAEEYNIPSSHKPSTPCLATRFEYGTKLDYEVLKKVENAEDFVKGLGFYNVRVRVHNTIARIEVDSDNIPELMLHKDAVTAYIHNLGFKYVTVDLDGFVSGSMDK